MDWTRTIDTITAVFTDGCDVVFLTAKSGRFRILAETMSDAKAYVLEKMNRPVRLLHMGDRCEFIFDLVAR